MRLVNQLNSLKTATEFATSQWYGQSGSATLPASGSDVPLALKLNYHLLPSLRRFHADRLKPNYNLSILYTFFYSLYC